MPKSRRDGRPTFIEAARRAQIVACAIDVIAEFGYARLTLEQVAQRAGISRGLISYHFAGRDDLVAQVVREVYSAGAVFMRQRIEAEATPCRQLRAYIESNLAFMQQHRSQMVALVQIFASTNTSTGVPGLDPQLIEEGLHALEHIFRAGQEAGEFRSFDRRIMAVAIRNVIDGVPPQIAANPALDVANLTRELVALFVHATQK